MNIKKRVYIKLEIQSWHIEYIINSSKFYDYAFFTLFPMLFPEYVKENKDKAIEVKWGEEVAWNK